MHISRRTLTLSLAATAIVPAAHAAERATVEEAKALAEKAAAHFKDVGLEKSIADFNDPAAGYIDRELYVAIYSPEGKLLCGYGVPGLVGRDATTFKDSAGNEFGKSILTLAKSGKPGWAEYRMTNSVSKKVEPKKSWVIGVDGYAVFVGAFAS